MRSIAYGDFWHKINGISKKIAPYYEKRALAKSKGETEMYQWYDDQIKEGLAKIGSVKKEREQFTKKCDDWDARREKLGWFKKMRLDLGDKTLDEIEPQQRTHDTEERG